MNLVKSGRFVPYMLLFFSFTALSFLVYSLVNRKKLQIPLTHPRILVEAGIFCTCLISGIVLIIFTP